jgi:hypothetical protein
MILKTRSSESGTSLIEATIAACTSAMFLGSLFTMNMTGMKAIRTAREASSASQVLQQRVEAMRIANWHQITNATWIRTNLMSTSASGSDGLKTMSETLLIVPYGSTATGTMKLVRSGGSTSIVTQSADLLKENALKVIWTVDYSGGVNGKAITRQTTAILAKGGVAKW